MKRLFTAALMTVFIAASAFASDANKVNSRIKSNFNVDFDKATNVEWTLTDNYAKASFTNINERVEAFYKLDGSLIGTSKKVAVSELPPVAKRAMAKKYADYTVTDAILFDNLDETAYYISAENKTSKIIFKVKYSSDFSIFSKEKKG